MLAWSIAQKVAKVLSDENNITCTVDELAMWFNVAQREIVNMKADALTANGTIALVPGTKQSATVVTVDSVAKTGVKLLDVVRNVGTYQRAIVPRKREVLDTMIPGWHSTVKASAEVKFFMFNEMDPLTFYNYPPQPATDTGMVEALVCIAPVDVTVAVDGLAFTAGQTFSLSDMYESIQLDLMLSRALSKSSKILANLQRAQAHYAAAATALGQKVQSDKYYAPRRGFSSGDQQGQ